MTLPHLLSALIFLPILAGVLLFFFSEDENPGLARGAALAVTVLNLLLSLPLLAGGAFVERFAWIRPLGIEYFLRVDGLSVWLIMLVTVLTPIAIGASWNLIRERAKVYYGCMLLLSGGMIGVLCAMDLFLFYVFWEIMLIPAFFLVGVFGGQARRWATQKFVIYTMVGSLLMLIGIVFVGYRYFATHGVWSFNLLNLYDLSYLPAEARWAFAAFLLAFAIKAALFPFHTWLPDTYGEAPAPVTFMLSAVMSKLGVYGLLRIALPLFPEAAREFAPVLVVMAVVGIVYAALIALVQDDAKRVVAYASISHMGVILLGVFTLSPQALSGAVLYMVGHALTTGALFLLVGFLFERKGTTSIRAFGGLTLAIPMFSAVFLLVVLGAVGLPGLAGFVGEFLIFLGAFNAYPAATAVAVTAIILGAAYMLWLFQRAMFGPLDAPENRSMLDLNGREGFVLAPIAALIIFVGVYPQALISRIEPAVSDYLALVRAPAQPVANKAAATTTAPPSDPKVTPAGHDAGGTH